MAVGIANEVNVSVEMQRTLKLPTCCLPTRIVSGDWASSVLRVDQQVMIEALSRREQEGAKPRGTGGVSSHRRMRIR